MGETISDYRKLAKDLELSEVWTWAFGKELRSLNQGDDLMGAKGTDTIFFMTHAEIAKRPKDQVVLYAGIVVDFRPQKDDPKGLESRQEET